MEFVCVWSRASLIQKEVRRKRIRKMTERGKRNVGRKKGKSKKKVLQGDGKH